MRKLKIGIIGLGGICTKHINELLRCEHAEITAICDIDEGAIENRRALLKLPAEKCYRDYRDLIRDPDVEAVEICTPNYLHAEMAIAAMRAGKHVNIEKPIAMNYSEALTILDAARESGVVHMTCFSYRFKPAVRYAKRIVDEGRLGRILGINVSYIKNSALWEGRRLEWRFVKKYAGSGVAGDLGVHLIDLAQMLAGNITSLTATISTAVTERQRIDSDEIASVETDDQCSFIAAFSCGAEGTFHISRCGMGHVNTIRYDVYGEKGAISFDLDHPDILSLCIGEGSVRERRFETVTVPAEYHLEQERAFVDAVLGKRDTLFPDAASGAQSQLVLDAILQSAEEKRWIDVKE